LAARLSSRGVVRAVLCRRRCQGGPDLGEDTVPVARPALAEEAHRGIPGTVGAVAKIEMIGRALQQVPHGNAERSREMGERGVGLDDKVQALQQRRRVGKVADQWRKIDDAALRLRAELSAWLAELQAIEPYIGHRTERQKTLETDGTAGIATEVATARPDETDP